MLIVLRQENVMVKAFQHVKKTLLPLIISGTILFLLAYFVDWTMFLNFLSNADTIYCGMAFLSYTVCQLLRGVRFTILLRSYHNSNFRWRDGLHVALIGGFANHILPMRTGELFFVLLPKMAFKVSADRGTGALLIARICDLSALAILTAVALMTLKLGLMTSWYVIFLIILCLIFCLVLRLDFPIQIGIKGFEFLLKITHLQEKNFAIRIVGFLKRLRVGLVEVRRPSVLIPTFFISLLIWACLIATLYFILASFGVSFNYWEVVIGSLGTHLAQLIPINAAGTFGTYEAGWAVGFSAIGMTAANAVSSGFASHIIIVIISGFLAIPSLIIMAPFIRRGIKEKKFGSSIQTTC